jgi:hypothetical protein
MTRVEFFNAVKAILVVFDDPSVTPADVQNIVDVVKITLAQERKTINGVRI